MNEIKKLRDNLYMYNNSYFTSIEDVYKYVNHIRLPKTDEEILEEMDINTIEKFLRKKKLKQLNSHV